MAKPMTQRETSAAESMGQKQTLRNELRKQRKALSSKQLSRNNLHIVRHLMRSDIYQSSEHIAVYLAQDGEPNLNGLVLQARKTGKHLYLPAIVGKGEMEFRRWHENSELHPGLFGTVEISSNAPAFAAKNFDLVLVPLVGFDRQGHRLGMGGGFYDRYFASLQPGTTTLIGVAHSLQEQESLVCEHWDLQLDAVVTEQGLTLIQARRGSESQLRNIP